MSPQVSDQLALGAEVDRQGLGAVLNLKAPFRLVGSVGPTSADGGGSPSVHAFLALGMDF